MTLLKHRFTDWWKSAVRKVEVAERLIPDLGVTDFQCVVLDSGGIERGRWYCADAAEATASARSAGSAYSIIHRRITVYKEGRQVWPDG